jgi:hypothetical protein
MRLPLPRADITEPKFPKSPSYGTARIFPPPPSPLPHSNPVAGDTTITRGGYVPLQLTNSAGTETVAEH